MFILCVGGDRIDNSLLVALDRRLLNVVAVHEEAGARTHPDLLLRFVYLLDSLASVTETNKIDIQPDLPT